MAVTYATITRAATGPTPKRTFRFYPQTEGNVVTVAAQGYEHVGPFEVTTGAGGTFTIAIPLGTDQGGPDLVWKVTETPVDKIPGRLGGPLATHTIGFVNITATIGYDDLIANLIDVTVVSPDLVNTVGASAATATTKAAEAAGSAAAALDSAANADSSADLADVSEANAAASASTASTQAGIATTKASEASTSAATATTKASEASTSAATATTKAGEASTSASAAQTARTGAETARTGAETARAGAEAVGNTNDGIMAGVDNNAASAFRVQQDARLSATFARKTGLVDDLIASGKPLIIAHRGGYFHAPEHTMEAYRYAAERGLAIEPDLWVLSDNTTIVALHNSTVDLTMSTAAGAAVTGNVNTFTPAQWRAMRVKPIVKGGDYLLPVEWSQIADEFGGRTIIVPEIKDFAVLYPLIYADIKARGLERSVILQSVALGHLTAPAADGIATMHVGGGETPAALAAAGVEFVALDRTTAEATIDTYTAAGIKVVLYTVNTRAQRATYDAYGGVVGYFSDDPVHIDAPASRTRQMSDPFKRRAPWPGWGLAEANWQYAAFRGDEVGFPTLGSGSRYGLRHTWAEPLPAAFTIRSSIRFVPTSNTDLTRFVGIYVGVSSSLDQPFSDNTSVAGQDGYHILVKRNGDFTLYRIDAGVATLLTNVTTDPDVAANTAEGVVSFELVVSASAISIRNRTTGTTASTADTTYRSAGDWMLTTRYTDTAAFVGPMTIEA